MKLTTFTNLLEVFDIASKLQKQEHLKPPPYKALHNIESCNSRILDLAHVLYFYRCIRVIKYLKQTFQCFEKAILKLLSNVNLQSAEHTEIASCCYSG